MGRGILLGNEDKKDIARQAAENILKETEEQDEAQALTESVLSEDQLDKQAKQAEIDIFDDVMAPRISKGIFVRVTIDKNGERILTNNTAPDWTWDKVQKKYGAGLYKVTLKDSQGKYVTSQSKTIGESMSEEKEEKSNQSTDSLLHYFSEQSRINEEKAKRDQILQEQRLEKMLAEIKDSQKKSSEGLTKIIETLAPTLLPLLFNKKDNSTEMVTLLMTNMQKSEDKTMALIEKMNDKTERMIEKLTDKMAEKKVDNGPSPIEVMEKMMKARSDGKKEAREEMQLIEEKAAELAEQRSENTAPESFTDKAIKSFLPALPQLLNMANKQPGMTVPQMPAPRPQAQTAPKVIPRTTNPAQTAKRPNLGPSTQVPGKKVENNRPSGTMGMAPLKEKVLNLTIPIILESMGTEEKAPVCAQKCYEVLAANGMGGVRPNALFSADDFVSIAKNGGILDLAKSQNKEAIAIEWLKELHGSFSQNPLRNLGNLPEEVRRPLPGGVGGNYFTVKIIKDLAHKRKGHPKVRKLAENIISLYGTKSQNFYDECMAIGKWVHKNVPYLKDPHGVESVKDPLTMIDQLCRDEFYGDCDDMVILICTLLLSIGHKPKVAIVRYPNFSDGYQHIYVVCYERNYREGYPRRIVIDAIVKDKAIGYEVPSIAKKEIDI